MHQLVWRGACAHALWREMNWKIGAAYDAVVAVTHIAHFNTKEYAPLRPCQLGGPSHRRRGNCAKAAMHYQNQMESPTNLLRIGLAPCAAPYMATPLQRHCRKRQFCPE